MFQSVEVSATGDAIDLGNANVTAGLGGARLTAASATATAVLRETDGSGRVLARLTAVANTADELAPAKPIAFKGKVHATITGTGALLSVFW